MVPFSKNNVPKYLLYKPRLTLYKVLHSCKIKDHHTGNWIDGFSYREVENENSQVYSRGLDSFIRDKEKWEVFYS